VGEPFLFLGVGFRILEAKFKPYLGGRSMPRENNSSFQRFAVVSFPDRASVQRIEELRAELPSPIAVMAPHVTLKGSFIDPTSIDEIKQGIEETACESSPLQIEVKSIHIGDPHMTVFYGLSADELNRAKHMVQDLEDLSSFKLTEVSLVGRIGSAATGQWKTIQSFPLGEQA
jgi:2'-5' RNA ligase